VHVFERIRGAALLRTSINGGLARAIYAPIALAFVLVYKASRMINFALGEWITFGSLLASTGSHVIADSTWVERCCLAASPWLY
jgi:branched-subunit amino acid ABC-type transport system permease component